MINPSWICLLLALMAATSCGKRFKARGNDTMEDAFTSMFLETSPLSVALFGLTGDGKSSVCQWLLGDENACKVGHEMESQTAETSVVTGNWFGDSNLDKVTVADTPGLADTKGRDATQWVETVTEIRKKLHSLDAIILVANFQKQRMTEESWMMIRTLRDSFGTDIWKRFAVVFTFFEWKTPHSRRGNTQEKLDDKAEAYRENFRRLEIERGVWNSDNAREQIEKEINNAPFFGVQLDDEYGVISASDPVASMTNAGVEPESQEFLPAMLGLPQLVKLKSWLEQRREQGDKPFDLENLKPRMGPSQVTADQSFLCFWPLPCVLKIEGTYLSDRDVMRITPWETECGTEDDPQEGMVALPVQFMQARSVDGNETQREFNLGETLQMKGNFRICYCEYGSCDVPARFSQEVGELMLGPLTCGRPLCNSRIAKASSNYWGEETRSCEEGNEKLPEVIFNETVTFECLHGYGVNGVPSNIQYTEKCSRFGRFEVEANEFGVAAGGCSIVECERARPVNKMRCDGCETVLKFNEVVKYECDQDYTITGHPDGPTSFSRTCLATGHFTDPMPNQLDELQMLVKGCRRWEATEWAKCSTLCGHGIQKRSVTCSTGIVEDCDEAARPTEERPCYEERMCKPCGSSPPLPHAHASIQHVGFQEDVEFKCESGFTLTGHPDSATRFGFKCAIKEDGPSTHLAGISPDNLLVLAPTILSQGCVGWESSPWSSCKGCNTVVQTRDVNCSTKRDDDCDMAMRPARETTCTDHSECHAWAHSKWTPCDGRCGSGLKTRNVTCATGNDDDCDLRIRPIDSKVCTPRFICNWEKGVWSTCNFHTCRKNRSISCKPTPIRDSLSRGLHEILVRDEDCDIDAKENSSADCDPEDQALCVKSGTPPLMGAKLFFLLPSVLLFATIRNFIS